MKVELTEKNFCQEYVKELDVTDWLTIAEQQITMKLKKDASFNWFLIVLLHRCWLFWLPSTIILSATCFMSFLCYPTLWGWWYQYCLSYQFLFMPCGVCGRRKEVSKMWVSVSSVLTNLSICQISRCLNRFNWLKTS